MLYVVLCVAYHSVKSYHLRFSGLTTLVWEEGASFLHSIINRLFVASVLPVFSIYIFCHTFAKITKHLFSTTLMTLCTLLVNVSVKTLTL